MRKLLLLPLFILATFAARAQSHGTIKAIVLDSVSHQPVQLATISLLKLSDTSLISYTVTDKNGAFILHNVKQEASRLLISHVGYRGEHIKVDFKNGELVDLGKIYLSERMLLEVTVKGERLPVVIKKDTIEFDALAFKTPPNAMVIDLLKRLPGIQVDMNQGITVNGKPVSKIRVNGKDYLSNQAITINNLPAEVFSKVQVYDDRDNDPDHLIPDYKVNKIINLKFKSNITKGFITSIGAGGGPQDKYAAAGFASKIDDNGQTTFDIDADNLSNTILPVTNYSGFNNIVFGNLSKSSQVKGQISVTRESKKKKFHLEYRASDNITESDKSTTTAQKVGDTVFTGVSASLNHSRANRQLLHIEDEWRPDSNTIIRFQPDAEYQYNTGDGSTTGFNYTNFNPLLNNAASTDHSRSTAFNYNHNFSYYHRINKKGASFTLGNAIGYHPNSNVDFNGSDLLSYIATFPSDTLRRLGRSSSNGFSQNFSGAYHLPINKKFSFDLNAIALHDRNRGEFLNYDEDFKTGLYTIYLVDQSSDLTRNLFGESINPVFSYNFGEDMYARAGINALGQQIEDIFNRGLPDRNRDYLYFFPTAELHIKQFTAGYSASVQQPGISQLQSITIVYSPLYSYSGNPALKAVRVYSLNGSYQLNKYQTGLNVNFYGNYTVEKNTIVDQQFINEAGGKLSMPVNGNGRTIFTASGGFNKRFSPQRRDKTWNFSMYENVSFSAGHNYFIVNQQQGYQYNTSVNVHTNVFINYKELFSLVPSYTMNYTHTTYKDIDNPDNSYIVHNASLATYLYFPKNFQSRIEYSYRYTPLAVPGFQHSNSILNFSVSRRIQKKNQGEIGLICYDLLNQNISQTHIVNLNTITDSQMQIQKRYVLLTYIYHFSKFN